MVLINRIVPIFKFGVPQSTICYRNCLRASQKSVRSNNKLYLDHLKKEEKEEKIYACFGGNWETKREQEKIIELE